MELDRVRWWPWALVGGLVGLVVGVLGAWGPAAELTQPRRRYSRQCPSGPGEETRMAFLFRLETKDGTPAEPPTLSSAVPNWGMGDTIPLGPRMLRVVDIRDDDAEQPPVLVVEDMAG